ncbi:HAD family hydrolase [Alicyclobacillus sp. ALC3]|uniref:HAD family hydrolase n=1 Tax=Alicyclobacillus sp. ALC3 TaxID=2796143 RepID=UPI00237835C9|nr:HAD family hydrolase [Alicyclobacillus sp. ALC3]WDL95339.1 HAD family hydrolase [Alicyclobacillus sp. ALC3]
MGIVRAAGREMQCEVLCLDKDGLMFERGVFWRTLWRARERALSDMASEVALQELRSLLGVSSEIEADANGPFALMSPGEEAVVVAALLYRDSGLPWDTALETAKQRLKQSDDDLDLRQALVPRPGFPDILHRAKAAGMKVAVVTADDESRARESLALFGVRDLVDLVCTPAQVKNSKPYPDMLRYVERELGVHAAKLVMVGDSLVDVQMAAAAGASGIGVPYPENLSRFDSHLTVDTLDDIELVRG